MSAGFSGGSKLGESGWKKLTCNQLIFVMEILVPAIPYKK